MLRKGMMYFNGNYAKYNDTFYSFSSLEEEKCILRPDRICTHEERLIVKIIDLEMIFKSRIWVKIRGCNAIFEGFEGDLVKLGVRPSNDVEILEAKEVDRGVFESKLPKSEITRMWEERYQLGDFPFPENLETIKELDLKEIL